VLNVSIDLVNDAADLDKSNTGSEITGECIGQWIAPKNDKFTIDHQAKKQMRKPKTAKP
jgi:hypothetical protein